MEQPKLIFSAIQSIMKDIAPIAKGELNKQQGFKYRGIDTVYNALHDLLAKHGVITVPKVLNERYEDRTTQKGGNLIYRVLQIEYTFYAQDGSTIVAVVQGEGMDSGDKASNKAMSIAHKYALLQVFAIPTDETKDPDADSPEPSSRMLKDDAALKEKVVKLLIDNGIGDKEFTSYLFEKKLIPQDTLDTLSTENAQKMIKNWKKTMEAFDTYSKRHQKSETPEVPKTLADDSALLEKVNKAIKDAEIDAGKFAIYLISINKIVHAKIEELTVEEANKMLANWGKVVNKYKKQVSPNGK
jgi:hypothetical protein